MYVLYWLVHKADEAGGGLCQYKKGYVIWNVKLLTVKVCFPLQLNLTQFALLCIVFEVLAKQKVWPG